MNSHIEVGQEFGYRIRAAMCGADIAAGVLCGWNACQRIKLRGDGDSSGCAVRPLIAAIYWVTSANAFR